jgi:hypothetical protein
MREAPSARCRAGWQSLLPPAPRSALTRIRIYRPSLGPWVGLVPGALLLVFALLGGVLRALQLMIKAPADRPGSLQAGADPPKHPLAAAIANHPLQTDHRKSDRSANVSRFSAAC